MMIFERFLSVRRLLTTQKNTNIPALNSNSGAASDCSAAYGHTNHTIFVTYPHWK